MTASFCARWRIMCASLGITYLCFLVLCSPFRVCLKYVIQQPWHHFMPCCCSIFLETVEFGCLFMNWYFGSHMKPLLWCIMPSSRSSLAYLPSLGGYGGWGNVWGYFSTRKRMVKYILCLSKQAESKWNSLTVAFRLKTKACCLFSLVLKLN